MKQLSRHLFIFYCLTERVVGRFSLGSRAQANRYIQQFTVIFTEEGRKSVRITHVVPGQPARVICTGGMREHNAKISALAQHQQHTLKQVTAQSRFYNNYTPFLCGHLGCKPLDKL